MKLHRQKLLPLLRNKIQITCQIKLAGYFFKYGENMFKRISIYLFLICIIITFCGCEMVKQNEEISDDVVINMPNDNTINGYRNPGIYNGNTQNSKPQTSTPLLYYANTSSKKFHKNTCRYATSTDNSKLYISENRNELILQGYSPCKICEP